ncbi:MAG: RNA methyltransferase [Helicobacteraceae bacterium]|nr:RNA methyltransferase [Helicobacteraceae bacterium]
MKSLQLIPLESIDSQEVFIYKQLRENHFSHDNSFIADSPKVVNEILKTSLDIKSILATQEYYQEHEALLTSQEGLKCYVASKEQMEGIIGHKIHHNCMLHGIRPRENTLEEMGDGIIMLDAITSTENLGSIARSAAALGVDSLILSKHSPHPYARRSLRVSMGHISKLKYHIYEDIFATIKKLQSLGYSVIAAEISEDAQLLSEIKIPKKWVLLMGHEGHGLSPEVIQACDATVLIEMAEGIKSLNVAVASSILMYQFKMGSKF